MSTERVSSFRDKFNALLPEIRSYFNDATKALKIKIGHDLDTYGYAAYYNWNILGECEKQRGNELCDMITSICGMAAKEARICTLTGEEDVRDIKVATKKIYSAFRLNNYEFEEQEVVRDDCQIVGIIPARQGIGRSIHPDDAYGIVYDSLSSVCFSLKMLESAPADAFQNAESSTGSSNIARCRQNSAFVMMWMDPERTELDDVVDSVRDVFRKFGINALRADDIEHEGRITDRILNEIRASEFLFADLSGERQNVYYEVGYAHALGKRVILFRRSGTGIHFDLAGYNCPEYENIRDLRKKLEKRLQALTGKNPSL